jgi:methylthioribulose 1-phosphate dehydratase/enolase-phosphatase E1
VPVPPPAAPDEEVIGALVANVEAMIDADRKLPALKQLQGRIWRLGFDSGEIRGVVYDDVAEALALWHGTGVVRSYIYSSGSREAQRLIFGNTEAHGDLRRYLSAFFDTSVGYTFFSILAYKIICHFISIVGLDWYGGGLQGEEGAPKLL